MKNYKLTNQDISANFGDIKMHLMLNDFRGAMAYWLASQQINTSIKIGIDKPLNAFTKYMQQKYFKTENDVYGSFEQVEVKSDGLRYPRSVQYFKTAESEGKTWHKTQKPKDLCKYIIETYSKQGDVVLDFTAGSGTSAIGIEIGRTVILVEKNLNEFEKLKERWEEKIIKTD